jgi:hypothetical protein
MTALERAVIDRLYYRQHLPPPPFPSEGTKIRRWNNVLDCREPRNGTCTEDVGRTLLRNSGNFPPDYTLSQATRQQYALHNFLPINLYI